jgi:hypothetical protein
VTDTNDLPRCFIGALRRERSGISRITASPNNLKFEYFLVPFDGSAITLADDFSTD